MNIGRDYTLLGLMDSVLDLTGLIVAIVNSYRLRGH